MIPYIINDESLMTVINGNSYTVGKDHVNFDKIIELLKNKQADSNEILSLVNVVKETKLLTIKDGVVYYKNNPIHNTLTEKMIDLHMAGMPYDSLEKFLENLMQNPSSESILELYDFLEATQMPLTDDGYFLAYKVVTSNFLDKHTGTFNNSIGATVSIDRSSVDNNRNNTCSAGLHFCSKDYIKHFKWDDDKIVIVKINPKDVVSIPTDYNNSKGRCCKYVVVKEYVEETDANNIFAKPAIKNEAVIDLESIILKFVENVDEFLYNYTNHSSYNSIVKSIMEVYGIKRKSAVEKIRRLKIKKGIK